MFEKMPQIKKEDAPKSPETKNEEVQGGSAPEMVIDPSTGLYTEKGNLENPNA